MTPEIRLFTELLRDDPEYPASDQAVDVLVGLDFSGWVLVRKSALRQLCDAAGVDYDDFDPTDGGRTQNG